MTNKLLALVAVVALTLVACGGDSSADHDAHSGEATDGSTDAMDMQGEVPGAAANASQADSEVLVKASDEFQFDPDDIDVRVGDIITFVIENTGKIDHEFVLGDATYQRAHEGADHEAMSGNNGISIAPGQTAELTWEFTEESEVLYGCHEPDHYDAGMVGTITVSA